MTLQEIHERLRAMRTEMTRKGYVGARADLVVDWCNESADEGGWLDVRLECCPPGGGHKDEINEFLRERSGEFNVSCMLDTADRWVANLPTARDVRGEKLQAKISEIIEEAENIGLDENVREQAAAAVESLRLLSVAISNNALEHKR